MAMSTQTLAEAGAQLEAAVLIDTLQILEVGPAVTVGIDVTRSLTPVGLPVAGLVQTTVLMNAIESQSDSLYSIKVARGTAISAGQAVRVITCPAEPDLVGMVLLLDKVSKNGLAMIRKAVASNFDNVNQEGKGELA